MKDKIDKLYEHHLIKNYLKGLDDKQLCQIRWLVEFMYKNISYQNYEDPDPILMLIREYKKE